MGRRENSTIRMLRLWTNVHDDTAPWTIHPMGVIEGAHRHWNRPMKVQNATEQINKLSSRHKCSRKALHVLRRHARNSCTAVNIPTSGEWTRTHRSKTQTNVFSYRPYNDRVKKYWLQENFKPNVPAKMSTMRVSGSTTTDARLGQDFSHIQF